MSKDDDDVTALGCLILLLLGPATALLDAWVIVKLWSWFMVPMGLSAITMRIPVAVDLMANLIIRPRSDGSMKWNDVVARVLFVPLVALAIGWCAARWLP